MLQLYLYQLMIMQNYCGNCNQVLKEQLTEIIIKQKCQLKDKTNT